MTNSAWAEADGEHRLVFLYSSHSLRLSCELALSCMHIWSGSQLQEAASGPQDIKSTVKAADMEAQIK